MIRWFGLRIGLLAMLMITPLPSHARDALIVNMITANGSFDHNRDGIDESRIGLRIIQDTVPPYSLQMSEFSVYFESIQDLVIGEVHFLNDLDAFQCSLYDYVDFGGPGTIFQNDGTTLPVYINGSISKTERGYGHIDLEIMDEHQLVDITYHGPFTGKSRLKCGKNWVPKKAE